MVFSSLIFICGFFPVFFLMYFLLRSRRAKNILLFVFSVIFYAWGEVSYMWLLLFSIFINWLNAVFIDRAKSNNRPVSAKIILISGIVFNLLVIGIYKYADFFTDMLNQLFSLSLAHPNLPLPVGISFFTFQIMSYVIDVYRGDVKVQKNIFIVAVYLAAFPQLIAGPVVRYSTVEDELLTRTESLSEVKAGLSRFIIGLSKKVLIANTVAAVADVIFGSSDNPSQYGFFGVWIAVISYTLQIYYDFSGYSDMAIGMGKMMGFHYLENFDHPYSAVNLTDFWRRWHISLSSFFRDYVYIPMGGNRVSKQRWILNMLTVWTLTGLWHGAGINFVLWGFYYGVLLILEKFFWGGFIKNVPVLRKVYTLFAVMIGWVIFRIEDIRDISSIFAAMFGHYGFWGENLSAALIRSEAGVFFVVSVVAGIFFAGEAPKRIADWFRAKSTDLPFFSIIADTGSVCLLILCILELETGSYNPFIYFRF